MNDQDEHSAELSLPHFVFTRDERQLLISMAEMIRDLIEAKAESIGDGVAAIMILARTEIDRIPDEDLRMRALGMCLSILFGRYKFEGAAH